MSQNYRILLVATLVLLSSPFFLAAPLLAFVLPGRNTQAAERVERFQPLNWAELARQRAGSEVVVAGRISASNPSQFRDLVAYTREREAFDGNSSTWSYVGEMTPPLAIELPDGRITISNIGYHIDTPHHVYYEGSERSVGFVAGDPVLVVGRMASSPTGPTVAADLISGDSRASYIERHRASANFTHSLGRWALLAGLSLAALAGLAWFLTGNKPQAASKQRF